MDPQQGDLPGLKNLLELKSKYDAPTAKELPKGGLQAYRSIDF